MADAKPDFNGKWLVVENENFDAFLAANGANWIARKAASKAKGPIEIIQKGDPETFTIRIVTMVFTREETFTIGVPFEQKQMNGALTEALASWDGNKLVMTYTPKDGKTQEQSVTRELINGQMVAVMKIGDVVSKRIFERTT